MASPGSSADSKWLTMSVQSLYNDAKSLISEGDILNGEIKMKEAAVAGSVKASRFLAFGY